jgi:hypothetical protein
MPPKRKRAEVVDLCDSDSEPDSPPKPAPPVLQLSAALR